MGKYDVYYWMLIVLFLIMVIPLQFYWPTVAQFRYTRQLPVDMPGALSSDIWTWEHIREQSYSFVYLIVLSGLFMVTSKNSVGKWVHLLVLFCFGLWFAVMAAFDIRDWIYGQVGPLDPEFRIYNPARSLYWCCLYGLQPTTARICANTALCGIGDGLTVNPNFVFRVVINGLLFLFVLGDMLFTVIVWSRNVLVKENGAMQDIDARIKHRKLRTKKYLIYK